MPESSRFLGVVIKMYFEDHPPPHFHAEYGEHEALVDIHALVVIDWSGSLTRARSRPIGLRRQELMFSVD
jgi:hypothetical protein